MSTGPRIAVLVEEGYQDLEFWYPLLRLREEGKPVTVVGGEADKVYLSALEYPVIPDIGISEARAVDFGVVIVPGGKAAGRIAGDPKMLRFIADAASGGALLAATAEGVNALAAAGALKGDRGTGPNGALPRADQPVVAEAKLVLARTTNDLPMFCRALFAELAAAAR
jgi:protease I